MSSANRRRLDKSPPQLDASTRTKRVARATLVRKKKPDIRLLARALLNLAAHERGRRSEFDTQENISPADDDGTFGHRPR